MGVATDMARGQIESQYCKLLEDDPLFGKSLKIWKFRDKNRRKLSISLYHFLTQLTILFVLLTIILAILANPVDYFA
jgi:hypothetical protein